MIDTHNIFHSNGDAMNTDVSELLVALVDTSHPIDERKAIWETWRDLYYNPDDLISFFDGVLFNRENGTDYSEVMCRTQDYRNFYELAMSLDMANLDPRAYYLYWIMKYDKNRRPTATNLAREAFEYDPETILSIFPDVKEIVFQD